jgi:ABC-type lipoprotein export system ATPase subunit
MSLIELERVSKSFVSAAGETHALKNVHLHIEKGEHISIIGPSGCGKSTLLHIIGCMTLPTTGSYRLAGVEVSSLTDEQQSAIRLGTVGFVFQRFHLIDGMSVQENVELPLVYAGVRLSERQARASEALAAVGISEKAGFRPATLSGGQQQRAAIARAIVNRPAVIVADEPTGNLDSATGQEVLTVIEGLRSAERTVIIVTHDQAVAELSDRLISMRDGEIVEDLRL